jgi:phosphatidylglycerol lysyltransferase
MNAMTNQLKHSMKPDIPRARELVLRYGWNATAYQIVNPGFQHWFSANGDAVVGFVRAAGACVVAGAPVCAEDRLEDVLAEWEDWSRNRYGRTVYFGAAGRVHERLSNRRGYSTIVLGAQPTWNPAEWSRTVAARSSLRAQFRRALNKGVVVREWPTEQAERDADLSRCLAEWLSRRGLPPMHFLIEPQTLADLAGRRVFVAERNGIPVGFLNASPIPARAGWLTEQFVRGKQAPNGTVELMIDAAARAVANDGAKYLTMGLVPLSDRATTGADNPTWIRWFLAWVRAHGRRFYDFDGLAAFKAKFRPHDWEPIYAVANEPHFSVRTLYAIASAFSGRSPVDLVFKAVSRAAAQEWRWFLASRS